MPTDSHSHVLQLDIQGTPQAWISPEQAAVHHATGSVAWVDGAGPLRLLRGGWNVAAGRQSQIEVYPIIALAGAPRINLFDVVPAFSKRKLLRRDRLTCAYCGQRFEERELQCEHILPESRGGPWSWMNLVAACAACNGRKADRTPEEAGMPLLYLPYVPSRFEDFLLQGRHIRADVHDWLASRLPKGSRLH
ncbi:HNH endonuclease [Aquabacterium sp. A7-Y]|uniref:HNH endonuclease n=1 Tax=Aquabacterium sp. A7-Y TaxID=1349605 RepID=UPI00223D1B4E|nr:HNH endonuclease [Aquabacterium sp. A7-Y]MCW7541742.1 HNH endonuclease [Aquabacterium sp. A7-Y]